MATAAWPYSISEHRCESVAEVCLGRALLSRFTDEGRFVLSKSPGAMLRLTQRPGAKAEPQSLSGGTYPVRGPVARAAFHADSGLLNWEHCVSPRHCIREERGETPRLPGTGRATGTG